MFRRLRSLLRGLAGRDHLERTMRDEMRFHIDAYAADLERSGLAPAEAARRARLEFGGLESLKEDCRQALGLRVFDELQQDIRYTLRLIRQTPGFTAAAVLSLGLGIGANTAIFSLIDAVMLRSLAVVNPHELFFLAHGEGDRPSTSSNYPLVERYRSAPVFNGVTAYRGATFKTTLGDSLELVPGQYVSGNYHAVIGAPIIHGRGFAMEPDNATAGNFIAVISEGFWTRRFGRAADVLGKIIHVQGRPVSIVGVTAASFDGFSPGSTVDITLPLSMRVLDDPGLLQSHDGFTSMPIIARLRAGTADAEAQAVVDALFRQYMSEPENRWARDSMPKEYSAGRLLPAGRGGGRLRQQYSTPLFVLMGMGALVLLIASANVANLLLARSAARAKEVAVRLCIGGARARLIRQFLTESFVLAAAGAVVGVAISAWGTQAIVALFGTFQQPIHLDVSLNLRVLAFTALVSLATAIAFGLTPALKATRLDLTPALKEGGAPQGTTPRRSLLGRALVAGQLAVCLVIIATAALLARSVHNLKAQDLGFDAASVVVFSVDTFAARFTRAQLEHDYRTILDRLREVPGVIAVSASTSMPISTSGQTRGLHLPSLPDTREARSVWVNLTTEDYHQTMGIRLMRGRGFTAADNRAGAPPVAIINETAARYVFGDGDPIGRTIAFRPRDPGSISLIEVIGVAEDTHQETLREAAPRMVYRPLMAERELPEYLLLSMKVRDGGKNRAQAAAHIRDVVRGVNGDLVVNHIRTLDEQINAALVRERALTYLAGAFAVLALLLACVGLYGVMSYNVARRTREFGIRVALGARRTTVLHGILRESIGVSLLGLVAGTIAALAATRVISPFLYGLSPRDPVTLSVVAAVLLGTAMLASVLPARRAMSIDPMRAMKSE